MCKEKTLNQTSMALMLCLAFGKSKTLQTSMALMLCFLYGKSNTLFSHQKFYSDITKFFYHVIKFVKIKIDLLMKETEDSFLREVINFVTASNN